MQIEACGQEMVNPIDVNVTESKLTDDSNQLQQKNSSTALNEDKRFKKYFKMINWVIFDKII